MAKKEPNTAAEKAAVKNKPAKAKETLNETQKRQLAAKKQREERAKKLAADAKKAEAKKQEGGKTTASSKEGKDERQSFTDAHGRVYKFKRTAPKTLNIDGVSQKTSDLIKDKEIMTELVLGNSNFVERIYN